MPNDRAQRITMTIATAGYYYQPRAKISPDVIEPMRGHNRETTNMRRPLQVRLLIAFGPNEIPLDMAPILVEADTFFPDDSRPMDQIVAAVNALLAELPLQIAVVDHRIQAQIIYGQTIFTCDLNAWQTHLLRTDMGIGV